MLIIISGVSGVGKNTMINELLKRYMNMYFFTYLQNNTGLVLQTTLKKQSMSLRKTRNAYRSWINLSRRYLNKMFLANYLMTVITVC